MAHLPNLEQPDADARLWLEDIESDRAKEWVDARNEKTFAKLAHDSLDQDRAALLKALENPGRLPNITRRGDKIYNFWKDEDHKRGIWRRTSLEDYQSDEGWETILDVDALCSVEGEDWVWKGADTIHTTHDLAIISLSRGGKDACVRREYDLKTQRFTGDFQLEESKGWTRWINRNQLLVSTPLGGSETKSGYGRSVQKWTRGTILSSAEIILEIPQESIRVGADIDHSNGRIVFAETLDYYNHRIHVDHGNSSVQVLNMPTNVAVDSSGDLLLVGLREEWILDNVYPSGSVLAFSMSQFLEGIRVPSVLFAPKPRVTVQAMKIAGGRVVLHLMDDLRSEIQLWSNRGAWLMERVPGISPTQVVEVEVLDDQQYESDGTLSIITEDSLTPPTLSVWKSGAPLKQLRRSTAVFDSGGLCTTRFDAVAADGEIIPCFVTGPTKVTGDAPVHLTGYGGFKVSMAPPKYRPNIGVLWLAKGGTAVVAALRGGGEFGASWHEAGKGPRKIVAQDDFAAVADDLVKRGITKASRIAAEGGSNGGLLIANMYARHPQKFGAFACLVPLVDMRRYNKLLVGASWISEYGNPDNVEEWAYLGKISGYHLVRDVSRHPPIFVATTRKDDRVHPGHARKFAAKLEECGAQVMYHEPRAGGHGYGADNEQISDFVSLALRFLRTAIGWE